MVIPSGGKNIGIRKSEFVTKTEFLCSLNTDINQKDFSKQPEKWFW